MIDVAPTKDYTEESIEKEKNPLSSVESVIHVVEGGSFITFIAPIFINYFNTDQALHISPEFPVFSFGVFCISVLADVVNRKYNKHK